MNCEPQECQCEKHKPKPCRELTPLLLDVWIRRTDTRPYKNLLLSGKEFERYYHRRPAACDIRVIAQFLRDRPGIECVELIYMNIATEYFPLLFQLCMDRKVACFSNTNVTAKGLECLPVHVDHAQMEVLRLNGVRLTSRHVKPLCEFVEHSKTLKYLDVGDCDLTPTTFSRIADAVWKSKSLKIINMSRIVPMSNKSVIDSSQIVPLIAILIKQTNLTEVHFQRCCLKCADMVPIAEYLCEKKPIPLQFLDLGSNNIGPKGVSILFTALKSARYNTNLIGLNLGSNILGEHGAEYISRMLPFTKIRYLDITYNNIPAVAIELILWSIKKPCCINILNVAGNHYSSDVGKILFRQINAEVLIANSIDLWVAYYENFDCYCVTSRTNVKANTQQRYYRITPYYRRFDIIFNKEFINVFEATDALRFRGMFIDPVISDCCDNVLNFDANDHTTPQDRQEITYIEDGATTLDC